MEDLTMTLRALMGLRNVTGTKLAELTGASRQNIDVAFARESFSKKLAGRIADALDAECVVLPNGELDFRPNVEVDHDSGRRRKTGRKAGRRNRQPARGHAGIVCGAAAI
jgi:hypothetical protein